MKTFTQVFLLLFVNVFIFFIYFSTFSHVIIIITIRILPSYQAFINEYDVIAINRHPLKKNKTTKILVVLLIKAL